MPFEAPTLIPAIAEITLLGAICVVLLVDTFLRDDQRNITYVLAMVGLIVTAAVSLVYGPEGRIVTFAGSFVTDGVAVVLKMFAYLIVAMVFLYSREYLIDAGLFKGEFYVLCMFGLLGVMVMISAYSLLTVYLGLELLSLSLYALVAFDRNSPQAAEAAMKYFVLGAIASGILLYGVSLIYGTTGTISLAELAVILADPLQASLPMLVGLGLIVIGIAFKFGAVPFHMWLPDVYEGSRTPVTLYLSSVPKLGAFALALRILVEGLGGLSPTWQDMLIVLAVLSMGLGNVVAIAQTNLKRMFAYSTISHVGFILLGFVAGTEEGLQGALFYTLTYVLMATAAFAMIILLSRKGFEAEQLADFKGLNARSPWFAFMMLLIMFSMAGVPPMVGFYGKLVVIAPIIDAGLLWLAMVAVLFSVIGAYYYLRVVWYMYFVDAETDLPLNADTDFRLLISANCLALLILGLFPGQLLEVCAAVF
jgi:NADH-quinone oxidoreductase subunit N